jgi:hypothetical protein
MGRKCATPFDPNTFLTKVDSGKKILRCRKKQILFSQGDAADAVFYILGAMSS